MARTTLDDSFFFSGVSAPGIGAKYGHFWADHVVDVANVEKKNGFNPKNPKKFDKKIRQDNRTRSEACVNIKLYFGLDEV